MGVTQTLINTHNNTAGVKALNMHSVACTVRTLVKKVNSKFTLHNYSIN